MQNINIFLFNESGYECIVTTKETIDRPFCKKITLQLEPAKNWKSGIRSGPVGIIDIEPNLFRDQYFYVKTEGWIGGMSKPGYMALNKNVADGDEYYSEDLIFMGTGLSFSSTYLFE